MNTAIATARPQPQPLRAQYLDLRAKVHRKLLNRLNLEALAQTDRARAEAEIRALLTQLLAEEVTPLSLAEREVLFAEVLDDVFGLGPLEPLLRDPSVSDILVNKHQMVFVERAGRLERVTASFQDDRHQLHVRPRTHRHDRGRSGTAAAPGTRGQARNTAAERGREGRDPAA